MHIAFQNRAQGVKGFHTALVCFCARKLFYLLAWFSKILVIFMHDKYFIFGPLHSGNKIHFKICNGSQ